MQTPKPLIQNQMLLAAQQQQVLSQAQAQNSLGSPPSYGDNDPRRFGGLPKGSLNTKEAQSARNDVCSPMQANSPQVSFCFLLHKKHLVWCLLPRKTSGW